MTDDEPVCETCDGSEVIEVSRSGHPLDPDAWEIPCPECQEVCEPDPDAAWDSRCDEGY